MPTGRRTTSTYRHAQHLLALLAGLCLIALVSSPAGGVRSAGATADGGIVAAAVHADALARVLPERPDQARPSVLPRHLATSAVLPSALLVALLAVLLRPRRTTTGTARQALLLSGCGPGPPSYS